jgi:hypothetical protein
MKKILHAAMLLGTVCFAINAQWVQTNGPSNHTVLSLAAQDSILFAGTYSGAYLSTDNGAHWAATGSLPFPSGRVLSLAVMGGLVFAGTDDGICRSSDNGTTWQAVDSGLPDHTLIHSVAVNGTNVYAGTHSHGVFLSADSGATWTAADSGLPAATSVYSLLANGSQVFAGTWGAGIFRLSNNQTVWSAANSGLPANATAGYVLSLAATGAGVAAGIGSAIYTSADHGSHWTISAAPLIGSPVNGLAAISNDFFAATYSSGVFHSGNNGLSWAAIGEGLPQTNSQGVCVAVSGPYLFLGSGNSGVWRRPLSEISAVKKHQDYRLRHGSFTLSGAGGCSSKISIAFSLPQAERVIVRIYNLGGSAISTIVDRRFNPGAYDYLWEARGCAPGCYTVKMQTGTIGSSQRIIIVR